MRLAFLPLLFVMGCESGAVAPQDTQPHAYLLIKPSTEQQGWAAIDALRANLPVEERKRIRTAGLVSSEEPTMYVDFDGTCSAAFVEAARQIAEKAGTSELSCSETLPGAL